MEVRTTWNLVQNEIQNARIHNLESAPGTPVEGQMYFNSSVGNVRGALIRKNHVGCNRDVIGRCPFDDISAITEVDVAWTEVSGFIDGMSTDCDGLVV